MVLITALLLSFATFCLYLSYVTLQTARRNGRLARAPYIVQGVAWAVLIFAFLLDVAFNVTLGSVLFLEPPKQLTFTARCKSHMAAASWRGAIARWMCEGWLNPFDEGHC